MHVRRGFINWGIFLICVGAVPLAVQLNVIDRDTATSLLRLWPLILIGIGLGLLLRFSRAQALGGFVVAATFGVLVGVFFAAGFPSVAGACNGEQTGTPITRNGAVSGSRLDLTVELTCGEMSLTRAPGGAWSVDVRAGNDTPLIEPVDDSLRLRSVTVNRFPFGTDQRESWQVVLPADKEITTFLTVNAATLNATLGNGPLISVSATYNAAEGRIDLSGTNTSTLNGTFNASTIGLILPSASFNGSITINAATLKLCSAPAVGLRITYDDTLSSQNFAEAGLTQSGQTWQSANYSSAETRAELHVSANVSTMTLNPVGGCQ
jgi:hypothetical protein